MSWAVSRQHLSATRRQRRHVPHSERPSEFVRQRNERERRRVDKVNAAFLRLSDHLPSGIHRNWDAAEDKEAGRGVSKIHTLRAAIDYIDDLQKVLQGTVSRPTRGEMLGVDSCLAGREEGIRHDYSRTHDILAYENPAYRSPVNVPRECAPSYFVRDREQYREHPTYVTGLMSAQMLGVVPTYNALYYVHAHADTFSHFD